MKQILAILFCTIGISVYAVDFTPMQATAPSASMQSVNNGSFMSAGSSYAPVVHDVGAYSPMASGPLRAKAGGFDDITTGEATPEGGYDPNNTQFSPIGDALIPLLLMGMAYATYIFLRRRKKARMMP